MIARIHVKNFRSLRDVELKLRRRNVLVGANMAGKSNLISVFRFLNQIVRGSPGGHGLLSAVTSQGSFADIAWRGGESNLISISLDGIDALGSMGTIAWTYKLDIMGDRVRGNVTVQDEFLRVIPSGGDAFNLIRKEPGTGNRVLLTPAQDVITGVHDASRSALEFELPDWEGNRLRNMFATVHFYKLLPLLMKQTNQVTAPTALDETGANLSAWLMMLQTRYPEDFRRINSALSDTLPDVSGLFTWPTQQATVFAASSERFLKTAVPVWQMSDGELCFVALLSLILSPKEYGAPLFCVEEPENHLNPKLMQSLIGIVDQRQKELGEQAAQVIVTTHSPHLVDKVAVEDVVIVDKHEGATRCTRVEDRPRLPDLVRREELGLGELIYTGLLRGE